MNARQQILEAQKRAEEEAEQKKRDLAAQWEESFNAEVEAACEKLEDLAKEAGLPFRLFVEQRVLSRRKTAPKSTSKPSTSESGVIYVDPANHKNEWTGRGMAPGWFKVACQRYVKSSLVKGSTPKLLDQKPTNGSATPASPAAH